MKRRCALVVKKFEKSIGGNYLVRCNYEYSLIHRLPISANSYFVLLNCKTFS